MDNHYKNETESVQQTYEKSKHQIEIKERKINEINEKLSKMQEKNEKVY